MPNVATPERIVPVVSSLRKRANTPKVRTGCITCKNRHVKCDERKPTCFRCEKACMPCAGYAAKTESRSSSKKSRRSSSAGSQERSLRPLQMIRPALPSVCYGGKDVIYYDFLRYSSVSDLTGYLHADFWSRIILCGTANDDCVQHAILAIGALSQALFLDSCSSRPAAGFASTGSSPAPTHPHVQTPCRALLNHHHRAAIQHQNQAISLCLQRTQDQKNGGISARTLLILTLLLVSYEFLQGNMEGADGLMTSGTRLLRDNIAMLANKQRDRTKEEGIEDMEYILPMISVGGNSSMCPQQASLYQEVASVPASPGTDTEQELPVLGQTSTIKFIYLWGNFHSRCITFITRAMQRTFNNNHRASPAMTPNSCYSDSSSFNFQEQPRFLLLLRQWHEFILDFRQAVKPDDTRARRALRLILLQYYTNLISLSWCLDASDTACDHYELEFRQILKIANEFLDDPAPDTKMGFTFGAGSVAGPLVLVATKCRNREIRLEALTAFKKMSWREGSWDAKVFVCCIGLVLIEEAGRDSKTGRIEPAGRWIWTGAHSDGEHGRVVGEYTRVAPDERGEAVKKHLLLDDDRCTVVDRGTWFP
ncbi:hypothetical protein QBC35DRAFT_517705 [Podospora australis]|uniref:Zn(2)-C6 fungal-type domain-containing protein n=1 Tax=Podospora australis TaxID=1536484 RepID=A0AAN7AD62_9PEZI|nr:hypothetical protein QBC35DRAFT_517705 [Podospora australis]